MKPKVIVGIMLIVLLIGILTFTLNIQLAKANETVYIRADGSIDPPTANITSADNVTYTFIGNIFNNSIVVERNNIVVDGAGYTLQGTGSGTGITLPGRSNVTIKNTIIKNWTYGIVTVYSNNNTISNNTVTSNSQDGIIITNYSNSNTVSGNDITLNGRFGILAYIYSGYNTISGNTVTSNSQDGIFIVYTSNNNTVSGNEVTLNGGTGIQAYNYSCYNIISNNTVTSNDQWGILLSHYSIGNTISNNTATSNGYSGVVLWDHSDSNTVTGNTATNNLLGGMSIRLSSGNTLRDNNMSDNRYNFGVWSDFNRVSDYIQDIDTSNTVDGKPVYYWVNQRDKQIPADAGYVQAVNCVNITVEDLNLTKNGAGVRFVNTTDSTIRNVTALNNTLGIHIILSSGNTISGSTITSLGYYRSFQDPYFGPPGWMSGWGIGLTNSSSNTVSGNTITNSDYGVGIGNSSDNTVSGNTITNNDFGIGFGDSKSNNISSNTITNNDVGVSLEDSNSNIIYHNNFVNNTVQANVTTGYVNTWDDSYPSGGNYWDNYNGTDNNGDWIGDTPYVIDANNTDRYPLMNPWPSYPETAVSVIPSTDVAVAGQLFTANITVSNVTDLYLWAFSISWNPATLDLTNITEGDFLMGGGSTTGVLIKEINQTGGYIKEATCSLLGSIPGVSGSGTLATITFKATAVGSSPLDIYFCDLLNSTGESISRYIIDSSVNIDAPDLSILNVSLPYPDLSLYANTTVSVNVTIQNTGNVSASAFNVSLTAYWNEGEIVDYFGKLKVENLEPNTTRTLQFNFTLHYTGNYTLTFNVDCNNDVIEVYETNNELNLTINVKMQGDIDGDNEVTYLDLFDLSRAYWSTPEDENWNPYADINNDGKVDYNDLFLLAQNYSE